MRAKAMYFESDRLMKLLEVDIRDNTAKVGENQFTFNKPNMIETNNPMVDFMGGIFCLAIVTSVAIIYQLWLIIALGVMPLVIWFITKNKTAMEPFYILHHSTHQSLIPKINKSSKILDMNLSPFSYKKLTETKMFEELVSLENFDKKTIILYIIIGTAIGFLIGQQVTVF